MSVDIALWDPEINGLPKTYQEAVAIYLTLSEGVKVTSNNKLIQFAEKIEHRLNHDPEFDHNLRFSFEHMLNLAKHHNTALFTIGLPPTDSADALRQVVDSAKESGLVVFYDLFGAVFLPDGQVMPEDKAEIWQGTLDYLEDPDFPMTLKKFQKLLDPMLSTMAELHGMKKTKIPFLKDADGYVREVELGQQYLRWGCEGGGGEYKPYIYLFIVNQEVINIYNKFDFYKTKDIFAEIIPNALSRMNIDKYRKITNRFGEITNHQELKGAVKFLEQVLFTEILDVAQNIKQMDYIINDNDLDENHVLFNSLGRKYFYSPLSLIIARLAGNPRFEELVLKREAEVDWGANNASKQTEFPKLLKYLREEMKPIV